ncbi:MAG TPA: hypothetical protein VHK06_08235 [Candidatus Limnocylindria bacterium]|nr:hypothetical protein [Candidatus Limnocylindria bacterium]
MERNADTDRTLDSVEQMDAGEPVNPITEDSELSEPGSGFQPGLGEARDANEEDEGPPARTTQMPR